MKKDSITFGVLAELLRRTKQYAVYGTGQRAVELYEYLETSGARLPTLFFDDAPKQESFAGIPIKKPQDVASDEFEYVLLATDTYQDAMRRRIGEVFGVDKKALTIYSEPPSTMVVEKIYTSDMAAKDLLFAQNKIRYRNGEKIRIAFLFQVASFWASWESLWEVLRNDERFEIQMLLFDRAIGEKSQMKTARKFLEAQQIDYIEADDFDIEGFRPHIMFYQTPYDSHHRPPYLRTDRIKARGIRIAYIPYGMPINDTFEGRFCDFVLGRLISFPWRVYTISDRARREFFLYAPQGGYNVRVTGHPKFDGLANAADLPLEQEVLDQAAGRKIVLWKVHFPKTLELPNGKKGMVTPELEEYLEFAEQVSKYPDLFFVFMPHPKFTDAEVSCRDQAIQLMEKVDRLENVFIYTFDDYRPPVLHSDFIMVDRSAVMVEAGLSGVPVLYLRNGTYVEPQPKSIKPLIDSYYQGSTCADMVRFIEQCLTGEDPEREARLAAFAECMPFTDGQCGRRIADDLVESLEQELPQ